MKTPPNKENLQRDLTGPDKVESKHYPDQGMFSDTQAYPPSQDSPGDRAKSNRNIFGLTRFALVVLLVLAAGLSVLVYAAGGLMREREGLAEQIKSANSANQKLQAQFGDLISKVQPLYNEIENLRAKLTRTQEAMPDIADIAAEVSLPTNTFLLAKSQKAAPQKSLVPLPSSPENRLGRLRDYLSQLEAANNQAQLKLDELSLKLSAKEKEALQLREEAAKVKNELERTSESQSKLATELTSAITALRSQLAGKEEEISALTGKNNKLEELVRENSSRFSQVSDDSAYVSKQLAVIQQEKFTLESKLSQAKDELSRQQAMNAELNQKVADLSLNAGKNQGDKIALGQLEDSRKNLQLKLDEMTSANDSLRATVSQLSAYLAKKEAEMGDKQVASITNKENLDALTKEKASLTLVLREKEKSLAELTEKAAGMETRIANFQAELILAKDREASAKKQLADINSVNGALQKKLLGISRALEPVIQGANSQNYPANNESEEGYVEEDMDEMTQAEQLRKKVEVILDAEQDSSTMDSLE